MRTWIMYCYKYITRNYYAHFGSLNYVKLHGLSEPIVRVSLIEDENGEYYGWIPTGKDTPTMIWKSEVVFSICFPYGYKTEEQRGKGKAIRLLVSENPADI